MKNRRMYITIGAAVLLLGALVLGLTRSEETRSEGDTLKIGVCLYRGDDTFISNLAESLRTIVGDYEAATGAHIYMSFQDAQNSQQTQNSQIERLLTLGYDVLCVNLVDRTSAVYVIDKAMEANVPVVFFNREPVQADLQRWDQLYYVGTDAVQNGLLEGQIVVDAYRENPELLDINGDGVLQYIMIEGEFRHQDAVLRTEGSVQTIVDAGIQVEKLDGGIADWERSQATALARDYFEKYGEQIELVICNNDDMALGVIDYLDAQGIQFANIVGIDGTPDGRAAVGKQKMLGSVVIDYDAQADLIFKAADALLRGETPESALPEMENRTVRAPMYIITPSSE